MLVLTGVGPVLGRILDRGSIRAVMALGAATSAACLVAMAHASALWQLELLFGVGVALGTAMLGPLSSSTVVAKWFRRKLGRAQGLVNMGGPAGGLLFAPIAGQLIARFGWRTTLLCYAGATLCTIPVVWAVVRNRPADLGQQVDGEADPGGAPAPGHAEPGWTAGQLARERRFWFLALPMGMLLSIATAWTVNFAPLARDVGVGTEQASLLIGVGAGIGMLGTALFRALADPFHQRPLPRL